MMNQGQSVDNCFGCENTDEEKTLISIKYKNNNIWVCADCLPKMLHGQKNIDDYI